MVPNESRNRSLGQTPFTMITKTASPKKKNLTPPKIQKELKKKEL